MKGKRAGAMPLRGRRALRPTVLISGFGPFPGIPFNASAELAANIAHRGGHSGSRVAFHSGLLPTAWEAGPGRASQLIRELQPDAIVHFGVASSATGFRIETRAINEASRMADCDGCLPGGYYVRRGGPPVLTSTLPTGLIFRRLKQAGVAVSMSQDAGRYLCNATLYNSLLLACSLPHRPLVGFIHIPALSPESDDPASQRRWAELRLGFSVILSTISDFLRSETGRTGAARPNRLRRALA